MSSNTRSRKSVSESLANDFARRPGTQSFAGLAGTQFTVVMIVMEKLVGDSSIESREARFATGVGMRGSPEKQQSGRSYQHPVK